MTSFHFLLLSVFCIFVVFQTGSVVVIAGDTETETDERKEEPNGGIDIYNLTILHVLS